MFKLAKLGQWIISNFISNIKQIWSQFIYHKWNLQTIPAPNLLRLHLAGGRGPSKWERMRTGGGSVTSMQTFAYNFFQLSTWSINYLQQLPDFLLVSWKHLSCVKYFCSKNCISFVPKVANQLRFFNKHFKVSQSPYSSLGIPKSNKCKQGGEGRGSRFWSFC